MHGHRMEITSGLWMLSRRRKATNNRKQRQHHMFELWSVRASPSGSDRRSGFPGVPGPSPPVVLEKGVCPILRRVCLPRGAVSPVRTLQTRDSRSLPPGPAGNTAHHVMQLCSVWSLHSMAGAGELFSHTAHHVFAEGSRGIK